MKRPSAFLSLIQRYSSHFSWIAIYAVFFLSASAHQSTIVAFYLTNFAVIPMVFLWAFIYHFLAPKTLHTHRGMFYLICFCMLTFVSSLSTEMDIRFFSSLYDKGMIHISSRLEDAFKNATNHRVYLHFKYGFLQLTTMAVATTSWLLDERKRLNRLQREHRTMLELKYLRAQINPHFLFNALNCIYSLTLIQDEKAPDSVMKLSEMLRYVTDDCRSDLVPLQKEITYISNYIDFQRIRMEQEPDVSFDVQIQNPSHKIPPMIFQPMVENCFKHSRITEHQNGYIRVSLTESEKQISFVAENSKPHLEQSCEDKERTGIGLQNVQQRLNILFKDQATLKVDETDDKYRIQLCIKYS